MANKALRPGPSATVKLALMLLHLQQKIYN